MPFPSLETCPLLQHRTRQGDFSALPNFPPLSLSGLEFLRGTGYLESSKATDDLGYSLSGLHRCKGHAVFGGNLGALGPMCMV